MKKYLDIKLLVLFFVISVLTLSVSCNDANDDFSDVTKIALRDAGNKILLSAQDSTSLVLPVKKIGNYKYSLEFGSSLAFDPDSLVSIIDTSFKNSALPENYRIEVIQCENNEVAYSCEINSESDKSILPCSGRVLPFSCYRIEVKFLDVKPLSLTKKILFHLYILFIISLLLLYFYKKKQAIDKESSAASHEIGSFKFFPEQNKLVKSAIEISLSKKECEILEIFVSRPNQIITRDELTKRVWEDNGVIVGRSLDTYISKLRKKLQDDKSIKLTNVHGVGYKLELQ